MQGTAEYHECYFFSLRFTNSLFHLSGTLIGLPPLAHRPGLLHAIITSSLFRLIIAYFHAIDICLEMPHTAYFTLAAMMRLAGGFKSAYAAIQARHEAIENIFHDAHYMPTCAACLYDAFRRFRADATLYAQA